MYTVWLHQHQSDSRVVLEEFHRYPETSQYTLIQQSMFIENILIKQL